jgi:hypothetical protein
MIPPVTTTPAITIANPQFNSSISIAQTAPSKVVDNGTQSSVNSLKLNVSDLTNRAPLTSPDLHPTPSPKRIAQSELPGGSTPTTPQAPPPSPSIRDTGSGYPSRIPANYFGPAIGFGSGQTSFGVVSRFPLGDKYSIRPSAVFGNRTTINVPITYDFQLGDPEPFERNPLVTFNVGAGVQFASGGGNLQGDKFSLLGTIGVDVNLFEGVALVASFNSDFNSNNLTNIGFGFEF